MEEISKEYALELADLYGIKYELLSDEEVKNMPEEEKFSYSEISSILGINDECHWISIPREESIRGKKTFCIKGFFKEDENYSGYEEEKGVLVA